MNYAEKLKQRIESANSRLCVGLDPVGTAKGRLSDWSANIISQTHQYVCAFKINLAFYESEGWQGMLALKTTVRLLKKKYSDIPLIGDAKRSDIASTSEAHAKYLFEYLGFDAVTLNPYLGYDALSPFIEREDKGSIIVCRTSNPGADEFQMLDVGGLHLWEQILATVADKWNTQGNCSAVIGGVRPNDISRAREIAGANMIFLVPGIGAQGGYAKDAVRADPCRNTIISSSRSVANAANPDQAASELASSISSI